MSADAVPAGPEEMDAAWVTVETSLSPGMLLSFARDGERMLRINSMYEFRDWRRKSDREFAFTLLNCANGGTWQSEAETEMTPDGLIIRYGQGLKKSTTMKVEATETGSRLTVTDDYAGTPEPERIGRRREIDTSLVHWGHDLHRYFRQWARWGGFRPFRWYMERVWLPMKPATRRIAFMLIAVTCFEFAAFLAVLAVFALEWH